MKKILLIYYQNIKPGGVAKALCNLANELVALGNEVSILFLMKRDHNFYHIDERVKIISIDTFSHWGFTKINPLVDKYLKNYPRRFNIKTNIYDLGQWDITRRWINKNHDSYDLIISAWYKISCQLALNPKVAAKTIAWEHNNFQVGGQLWNRLKPKFSRLKGVVCINTASTEFYKQYNKNTYKITNIIGEPFESINGINFDNKKNQLIYVGRLDRDKNVIEILKILKNINLKDFCFKIIGEGPSLEELQNFVENNNLKEKVIFEGRKSPEEIKKELLKCKIFLFTSKTECLPTVLLESLFCGNFIISYNCNYGPSDIINDNNGFLIPMNNDIEFAEKLQLLINSPEILDQKTQLSFVESQNWRKEKIIKQWMEILSL